MGRLEYDTKIWVDTNMTQIATPNVTSLSHLSLSRPHGLSSPFFLFFFFVQITARGQRTSDDLPPPLLLVLSTLSVTQSPSLFPVFPLSLSLSKKLQAHHSPAITDSNQLRDQNNRIHHEL